MTVRVLTVSRRNYNERRKADYHRWKSEEKCVDCGATLQDTDEGVRCVEHQESFDARTEKYYATHVEERREQLRRSRKKNRENVNKAQRQRMKKRRDAKTCMECPAAALPEQVLCRKHLNRHRARARDWWRRRNWPRIAARNLARVARAVAGEPIRRAA